MQTQLMKSNHVSLMQNVQILQSLNLHIKNERIENIIYNTCKNLTLIVYNEIKSAKNHLTRETKSDKNNVKSCSSLFITTSATKKSEMRKENETKNDHVSEVDVT